MAFLDLCIMAWQRPENQSLSFYVDTDSTGK